MADLPQFCHCVLNSLYCFSAIVSACLQSSPLRDLLKSRLSFLSFTRLQHWQKRFQICSDKWQVSGLQHQLVFVQQELAHEVSKLYFKWCNTPLKTNPLLEDQPRRWEVTVLHVVLVSIKDSEMINPKESTSTWRGEICLRWYIWIFKTLVTRSLYGSPKKQSCCEIKSHLIIN